MTAMLSRPHAGSASGPPSGRPRGRPRPPWDWAAAGASTAAVLLCSISLHGVLDGWSWLPPLALTTATVVFAMAAARRYRFPTVLVPAAGLAALAVVLSWLFAASTALLGLLPTGGTVERAGQLVDEAQTTVMNQVPPVLADPGIVFIACLGTGLIALLVDTLATTLRMPAASGAGLLSLLIVPAVLKPASIGIGPFILAVSGYLLILGTGAWLERPRSTADTFPLPPRGQIGTAAAIGAGTLAVALGLSAALPGFTQGSFPEGSRLNIWAGQSGLNPVVALGNDLRQPSASGRIRYATDSNQSLYLRSTTLEDFSGKRWAPDLRADNRRNGLLNMAPAEGLQPAAEGAEVTQVTTRINSDTYTSPWLLTPYAPVDVTGTQGRYSWDPKNMTVISTEGDALPRLNYEVQSRSLSLDPKVLQAISPAPGDAVDPIFTSLPEDLPESIRDAAQTATRGASGPYEQAMAIQTYLRGPGFSYSLDAPVEGGYDGNGMDVLDRFLQEKSGYCVHFAAAMAVMARESGIPSRMALGFAPGRTTGKSLTGNSGQELREYEVDSRDAHAWPELYFDNVGWVRFEPTPSRGSVPAYAVQPRSPGIPPSIRDENPREPTPANPAPRPQPSASSPVPPVAAPAQPADAAAGRVAGVGLGLIVAGAALLSPWALRRRRRSLRRSLMASGHGSRSASLAWDEASDTGVDYGYVPQKSESPRAYALRVADDAGLPQPSASALQRLREAYEREVYAAPAARGQQEARISQDRQDSRGSQDRLWEDVTLVQEGLEASATRGTRLRARFFPASLASRFER